MSGMNDAIIADPQTDASQKRASAPRTSAWVMANAGTGKTHVLTQRVVRLLLEGVAPSRILCLTFTKAAAANMAQRVYDTLRAWTMLDDAALRSALAGAGRVQAAGEDLAAARRLFARTIETPGGLKIQTIHAFCERLLHLFPFEANVPADFDVADPLKEAQMQREALRDVVRSAEEPGALAEALERVSLETFPASQDALLRAIVQQRSHLARMLAFYGGPEACARVLARAHGLGEDHTEARCEATLMSDGITRSSWPALAARLAKGSTRDKDLASSLMFAHSSQTDEDTCTNYLSVFFTDKGEPRGGEDRNIITRGLQNIDPGLLPLLRGEQSRLENAIARLNAARLVARTRAMLTLAHALTGAYEARKSARGILDYEDMIERTRALLSRSGAAAWVLFKLDRGIDHILIDEAQDTSPAQWEILRCLSEEFLAGVGAAQRWRTFFAVGDEKQSIFSFQGAAPEQFEAMRRHFKTRIKAAKQSFADETLHRSFRSTAAIIKAVDAVFAVPANFAGLQSGDAVCTFHESAKGELPGLIELWPPAATLKASAPPGWLPPATPELAAESGAVILARRVARRIAMMLRPGAADRVFHHRTRQRRPVRPGDIMILVRRRNAFFEAVIRALKQEGVPVAGADRLRLTDHIAVSDLIAAGQAALLPDDDLVLAALLKSPLFGLDDGDLLMLAPGRRGSLHDALRRSGQPSHQAAHERLERWRDTARRSTAFGFYAALLGADGGRSALIARLGSEAGDAIDEFLSLALDFDMREDGSLARFLLATEQAGTEIKRDLESTTDAVRVMTVHAAKGLEAKIVFLPDTCAVPGSRNDPVLMSLSLDGQPSGAPGFLVWPVRSGDDTSLTLAARALARQRQQEEYRRLLYVAMTRAEEMLIIAGETGAKPGFDKGCWYEMIEATLKSGMEPHPAFWSEGGSLWRTPHMPWPEEDAALPGAAPAPLEQLPAWLFRPAPQEAGPVRRIRPSRSMAASSPAAGAVAFGDLVHEAIEYLAGLHAEVREVRLPAFLAARGGRLAGAQIEAAGKQALSVLADLRLARLFGPDSMAEVAVAARVTLPGGEPVEVTGRIDRLAQVDGLLIIADFKTGMPGENQIAVYAGQLALYRAALAQIPGFGSQPIEAMLVFTGGPDIRHFDAAALDRAFAAAKP